MTGNKRENTRQIPVNVLYNDSKNITATTTYQAISIGLFVRSIDLDYHYYYHYFIVFGHLLRCWYTKFPTVYSKETNVTPLTLRASSGVLNRFQLVLVSSSTRSLLQFLFVSCTSQVFNSLFLGLQQSLPLHSTFSSINNYWYL